MIQAYNVKEVDMEQRGSLTVVSGFSGAGKGTIMKELLKRYDNYALSVSMTTRAPRPGEVDGREYFFVTQEEFDRTVRENGLLEYAGYVGHSYGTPRKYVEEQIGKGKDVILEIDVQGGMQVRKIFPETILIFVSAPSAKVLKERLSGRGSESREVIEGRLAQAREEAKIMTEYDYILINDDLNEAVEQLHHQICSAKTRPAALGGYIDSFAAQLEETLQ